MDFFIDTDFEEGMCILVDNLEHCIINGVYGLINKKCGKFNVSFIFLGLKQNADEIQLMLTSKLNGLSSKRKLTADVATISKRIKTEKDVNEDISSSMESLLIESEGSYNFRKRKTENDKMGDGCIKKPRK